MNFEDFVQLSNLFWIPIGFYVVHIERRLTRIETILKGLKNG